MQTALRSCLCAVLFWLAACGKPAAPPPEPTATAAPARADAPTRPPATVPAVHAPEAAATPTPNPRAVNDIRMTPMAEVPPQWPAEMLDYPGMEVTAVKGNDRITTITVTGRVNATTDEVIEHYSETLSNAGFTVIPPKNNKLMAMKMGTPTAMVQIVLRPQADGSPLEVEVAFTEK